MASRRLQNAAKAAGFAMVNPEDFEHESPPAQRQTNVTAHATSTNSAAKSWLAWDYTRLISGKATA